MKKTLFTLVALFGAVVTLSAMEAFWNGRADSLRIIYKANDTKLVVKDGNITMTGVSGKERYHYLAFRLRATKPFKLRQGQAIRVTFQYEKGENKFDSFYIKTRTANSKYTTSWNTYNITGDKQTVTFIPGKSGNGINWIASQVKAPLDAVVTDFDIFFGKRAQNTPMKCTVYKIEIIDVK